MPMYEQLIFSVYMGGRNGVIDAAKNRFQRSKGRRVMREGGTACDEGGGREEGV